MLYWEIMIWTPKNVYLDYDEIQNISNKEFKRRYGDRAFSWRGRNIIKRNMEIILDKYDD